MTRLQTQAEANAYWETVELKKWVVTFTAGSRNKRRNAESLVTSRNATGARKAAIKSQQTEYGNDWVTSAMSTVRLATAQDLGSLPTVAEAPPAEGLVSVLINETAYEVQPVVAAVILRLQIELQQVTSPADTLDAETALRKVLCAVQRYLPPDGISIDAAMNQVIEAIDPWPVGRALAAAEPVRALNLMDKADAALKEGA